MVPPPAAIMSGQAHSRPTLAVLNRRQREALHGPVFPEAERGEGEVRFAPSGRPSPLFYSKQAAVLPLLRVETARVQNGRTPPAEPGRVRPSFVAIPSHRRCARLSAPQVPRGV